MVGLCHVLQDCSVFSPPSVILFLSLYRTRVGMMPLRLVFLHVNSAVFTPFRMNHEFSSSIHPSDYWAKLSLPLTCSISIYDTFCVLHMSWWLLVTKTRSESEMVKWYERRRCWCHSQRDCYISVTSWLFDWSLLFFVTDLDQLALTDLLCDAHYDQSLQLTVIFALVLVLIAIKTLSHYGFFFLAKWPVFVLQEAGGLTCSFHKATQTWKDR